MGLLVSCSIIVGLSLFVSTYTPCGTSMLQVQIWQTTLDGTHQLTQLSPEASEGYSNAYCLAAASPHAAQIRVDDSSRFQTIIGFGGAFTEAAALNLQKLSWADRDRVLEAYFGPTGIGYTMGRVPINSCDFSVASYSFDDVEGDWDLKHFDDGLGHDEEAMLPMIRDAVNKYRASSRGQAMKIFGSPWSPPAWLKQPRRGNQSMVGTHEPDGLLQDSRAKLTWAKYMSRWVKAYQAHGVPIWGLTVQNEPEFAAPWEACKYNASSEAAFIRDYLGPLLRKEHPDVKLMAFDHNKNHIEQWTEAMWADPTVADYVDGMAFHWYAGGANRLLDGTIGYHNLARAHSSAPGGRESFFLASEGCNCPGVAGLGTEQSWLRAERYTHDILADLNSNAAGWLDWNLLLDHHGGPNHLGNVCDSPIICSEDHSTVRFQPYYFAIGHFSKFIVPGSVRLGTTVIASFTDADPEDSRIAPGLGLSLWPCDASSRQTFYLRGDGLLQLADRGTKHLCVANAESPFLGNVLSVVECEDQVDSGAFDLIGDRIVLRGSNGTACLAVDGLYTDHLPEGGAPLVLEACAVGDAAHQQWAFAGVGGKGATGAPIESKTMSGMCTTAGWPFIMSTAFETPQGKIVVVVVNESTETRELRITTANGKQLSVTIPGNAVQTLEF